MGSSALSILLSKQRVETNKASLLAAQFAQSTDPSATRAEMFVSTRTAAGKPIAVYTTTPERHIDTLLQETIRTQKTMIDGLGAQVDYLSRYTSVFGTKGQSTTLSQRLTNVIDRLAHISIDPTTPEKKYETVHAFKEVTDTLNSISTEIMSIRKDVDDARSKIVDEANTLITDISNLGKKLADLTHRKEEKYQTENELDAKVHELSGILDIRVVRDTSGQYTITTNTFQTIYSPVWEVDPHETLSMLTYPGTASVIPGQPMSHLMLKAHPREPLATIDIEGAFSEGLYGGLSKVDKWMVDFQEHLDEFTEKFTKAINDVHCLGASKIAPDSFTGTATLPGFAAPMTAASPLTASGVLRLGVMDNTTGRIVSYRDIDLSNPITTANIASAGDLIAELSNGTGVTATISALGKLQLNLTAPNANYGIVMGRVTGQNPPLIQGGAVGVPPAPGPNTAEFQIFFGLNRLIIPGPQKVGGANIVQVRPDILLSEDKFAVGYLIDDANPNGKNVVPAGDLSIRTRLVDALKNTSITFATAGGIPGGIKTLTEFAEEIVGRQSANLHRSKDDLASSQKTYDTLASARKNKDGIDPKKVFTDLVTLAQSQQLTVKALKIILSLLGEVMKLID